MTTDGFPIGGVAAFDMETGIISPGGVGYDINCLTADSEVLTEFGYYRKIDEFSNLESIEVENNGVILKKIIIESNIPSLNLSSKRTENRKIRFFMSKNSDKNIFRLKTKHGFIIKATEDHPFLTKQGMVRLGHLNKGDFVAVNTFKGVEFKKIPGDHTKLAIIAKIIGYLFGDGYLYSGKKPYTVAYGKKQDLLALQQDIERLGFNSSLFQRQREHKIVTQYGKKHFKSSTCELHIKSKAFAEMMKYYGLPEGNKTQQAYDVPKWITDSPKWIKRLFLAGFFGAELSKPKTHTKTGFYSPILSQNKVKSFETEGRKFMLQIAELLKDFDVAVSKITSRDEFVNKNNEKTTRIRMIISAKEENLLRLWREIGFEYNNERKTISNIASFYIFKKKAITENRKNIAFKVKDYKKKGFRLKELYSLFKEEKVNKRFIERSYYENASQRINLDFCSFDEFKKFSLEILKTHGSLFDEIVSLEPVDYQGEVYDFNIEKNHNFIANGFFVSNCGVRLLRTDFTADDIEKKKKELLDEFYKEVPAGVGKKGITRLLKEVLVEVLETGAKWAVKNGFGTNDDLLRTEENGCMETADAKAVSDKAFSRGMPQLGTLGAGNHFLELQKVDAIYDKEIAKLFGVDKEEQVLVMIHCGSRGLGHQVASDYIKLMEDKYGFENLADRELINAPIKSDLGQKYLKAMACAMNFAFVNRQMIAHWVRDVFKKVMGTSDNMTQIYDVCHNIAKIETHIIDGKEKTVCVHRKGATRSFGPGRVEIPDVYRKVGQPVLIPGSMGTASYLLVGTSEAEQASFGSTAHGAGRIGSRHEALKKFRGEDIKRELEARGIAVKAVSPKTIAEEAPEIYKDIDEVIKVSKEAGLAKPIVRLVPLGVMKG